MNYNEWVNYMKKNDFTDSEIKDIIEFYALTESGEYGDETEWKVKSKMTVDDWFENLCDSIYAEVYGDVGSFLKLHYVADSEQFAMEFAEWQMDDGMGNGMVVCPSTHMVVIWEET